MTEIGLDPLKFDADFESEIRIPKKPKKSPKTQKNQKTQFSSVYSDRNLDPNKIKIFLSC